VNPVNMNLNHNFHTDILVKQLYSEAPYLCYVINCYYDVFQGQICPLSVNIIFTYFIILIKFLIPVIYCVIAF
jgi:hypothetical protein